MTFRTRRQWTVLLTTCMLAHVARTDNYRPGANLPNTNFFYDLQSYGTSRNSLVPAQKEQQPTASSNSSSDTHGETQSKGTHIQTEKRENISVNAFDSGRILGDNGRKYKLSRRKGRSSYENSASGFHRSREGVRNGDRIVYRRNGCSGMRYEEGQTKRQVGEGVNCDDGLSPSDYPQIKVLTPSVTSPNPMQESDDTSGGQVESHSFSDDLHVTAPYGTRLIATNSTTISDSDSQRRGRNGNYRTDLVPYGYAGSRQTEETSGGLASLRHERIKTGIGETSRNGRQTMAGGEVVQPAEPTAVAEPRQKDAVWSYYDFLINEGSYKFWATFQVITAILLIYSAFAAIYYAKYTFSMMDYPDYLDEGFFFKRSGEVYISTTTARPSSYSFLGLSSQTFQRIMNALSSEKYS